MNAPDGLHPAGLDEPQSLRDFLATMRHVVGESEAPLDDQPRQGPFGRGLVGAFVLVALALVVALALALAAALALARGGVRDEGRFRGGCERLVTWSGGRGRNVGVRGRGRCRVVVSGCRDLCVARAEGVGDRRDGRGFRCGGGAGARSPG